MPQNLCRGKRTAVGGIHFFHHVVPRKPPTFVSLDSRHLLPAGSSCCPSWVCFCQKMPISLLTNALETKQN
jgi:iron only hydrogenase large subunit-like protein